MKNPPEKIQQQLVELLKVENPKFQEAIAQGRTTWGINPVIMNFDVLPDDSLRIPRGMRTQLLDMIDSNTEYTIVDGRSNHGYNDTDSSIIQYRPYQERAMHAMYQAEEGLLVAPAGSGKTVLGLSMIPLYGQPCLWLTHTRALANQALERIKYFLPGMKENDVGLIGDGKWKKGNWITVGLIPTLVRRVQELHEMRDDFGLVILDEAHHCPASTFLKVVSYLNPLFLYGLTATPYRRDRLEKLMFQTIGPEIVRISVEEVEKQGGIIMPKIIYRTFSSKPVHHNNIQKILREDIVGNDRRSHMIVGDVLKEAVNGNFCIVVTDRKVHADILFDLISKGWEKTGIATGNYTKKYVTEQAARLNSKEISVLICTFALLGEGFDVPFLNRAFISMPFRAEGKVEQLIGRVQRPADGKTDAIVYDYVDSDIGVLVNQFYAKGRKDCRCNVYKRLGLEVEPYDG